MTGLTAMNPDKANATCAHGEKQAGFTETRRRHWDNAASSAGKGHRTGAFYHRLIEHYYRHLVPPGLKVLELGCDNGDLMAALKPREGVGVDFSAKMLEVAKSRHPELRLIEGDVHTLNLAETFDVIILSDLIDDLWDVQCVFKRMRAWSHPGTRIVINSYSRVWQPVLEATRRIGLATPLLPQNWFATEDIINLLELEDYEVVRRSLEILLPLNIPVLSRLCNRWLAKIPPFKWLALTTFIVARPKMKPAWEQDPPLVSVIIPARNEAGNITEIMRRMPDMGAGAELIFVEGNSTDDTYAAIEKEIAANPHRRCKLLKQPGKGKGDAVKTGFAAASGEILMILDADMTVAPEDLPRFYEAIHTGRCEFCNGVRLVYPMESKAMRFFNLIANKGFSLIFSWLLSEAIKDTLCGTKVLSKANYEKIAANRAYFGDFDPFGDFDLIFGAAKQSLRMMDMPIRYRERTYGATNIQRWRHGWLLLRMLLFAARKIRFV
jgi:2-polyprenyl-3-methyl-5-hydroxy-6-metoxy-1,4-benzoquinol methylase